MRPKPTREWVMAELERIGVRVVSGRLARKSDDDGDDGGGGDSSGGGGLKPPSGGGTGTGGATGVDDPAANFMGNGGGGGWGADDLNNLIARRNSTLGMSMMDQGLRRGSLGIGSMVGFDGPGGAMAGGTFDGQQMARRASSLGLGTLAGGGLSQMGMPVNPNQ
jgi:hypothetical protein